MKKNESIIGTRIRDLRMKANMTQAELAEKAGVNQAAISLIESGKRTKLGYQTLTAIARVLEVAPSAIGETEPTGKHLGDDIYIPEDIYRMALNIVSKPEGAELLRRLLKQANEANPELQKAILTQLGAPLDKE